MLKAYVRQIFATALAEDCANEDITTQACIDKDALIHAEFILKQPARTAGLIFLSWAIDAVDPLLQLKIHAQEGKDYEPGTMLASIQGKALSILSIERTLLNLLQHTCGVATTTLQYVQKVGALPCAVRDTRKTLPGLRLLQKYAVTIGGGKNHRFDLKECFLIKNNHLRILKQSTHRPIYDSIQKARLTSPDVKIEVEVDTLDLLQEALEAGPDAILLDNMSTEQVAQAVKHTHRKIYLEASGGINLFNVRAYAETGVNAVAIGALTHSSTAVDISLRIYGT